MSSLRCPVGIASPAAHRMTSRSGTASRSRQRLRERAPLGGGGARAREAPTCGRVHVWQQGASAGRQHIMALLDAGLRRWRHSACAYRSVERREAGGEQSRQTFWRLRERAAPCGWWRAAAARRARHPARRRAQRSPRGAFFCDRRNPRRSACRRRHARQQPPFGPRLVGSAKGRRRRQPGPKGGTEGGRCKGWWLLRFALRGPMTPYASRLALITEEGHPLLHEAEQSVRK